MAVSGNCLYISKGMAIILEILSITQFSIFRFASNHMPAHAEAETILSQNGTTDVVNLLRII